MALNALRTEMVTFTGTPGIEVNGVVIGYKAEYTKRTSPEAKYNAIAGLTTTILADNGQYFIQLGEQLYDGDLRLANSTDAFGRPSRYWEYDGKEIGTYMKKEILSKEWYVEVTGKDLYDELGKSTIEDNSYDFFIYVDGEDRYNATDGTSGVHTVFNRTQMNKNNKAGVGETGDGTLTQLFVDSNSHEVTVAVINTYLARAKADYNEKRDEVSFDVYAIDKGTANGTDYYWKNLDRDNDQKETMIVSGEDFDVANVQEKDTFLVTVAEGEIQTMAVPEVISAATLDSFKQNDNVVAEGTTYKYTPTAQYDVEVLDDYTGDSSYGVNLKDKHYNIYLDKYNNLIGIDLVEDADNYVFITGVDSKTSNLSAKQYDANAIFLDGTMKTITFDNEKSTIDLSGDNALLNTWCTYTVSGSSELYTLKEISKPATTAATVDGKSVGVGDSYVGLKNGTSKAIKAGQYRDLMNGVNANASAGKEIDVKHVSLRGSVGASRNDYKYVYGNDATVYLNVEVKGIYTGAGNTAKRGVVSKVSSVTTGIKSASLEVMTGTDAQAQAKRKSASSSVTPTVANTAYGAYVLYNDKGYVIAAVTVADDSAASENLVYVNSESVSLERYTPADDEWTWQREVIQNGDKVTLTEVGDSISILKNLKQHNWYVISYNADGEVISANHALDELASKTATKHCDVISNLESVINGAGVNTVLYEKSDYNGLTAAAPNGCPDNGKAPHTPNAYYNATGPKLENNTFYDITTATTGFYVNDDVKVVFIQKVKNVWETELKEGKTDLENVIDALNKADDGKYDYEVSAILNAGRADVVVIRDLNAHGDSGNHDQPTDTDLVVDLTTKTDVKVKYTGSTPPAVEDAVKAIRDKLEKKGFTVDKIEFVAKDERGAGDPAQDQYEFTVSKSGIPMGKYIYKNVPASNIKEITVKVNGSDVRIAATVDDLVELATAVGSTIVPDNGKWVKTTLSGVEDTKAYAATPTISIADGDSFDFGYYEITVTGSDISAGTGTAKLNAALKSGEAQMYAKAVNTAVEITLTGKTAAIVAPGVTISSDVGTVTAGAHINELTAAAPGNTANVTVTIPGTALTADKVITLSAADYVGDVTMSVTYNGTTKSVTIPEDTTSWVDVLKAAGWDNDYAARNGKVRLNTDWTKGGSVGTITDTAFVTGGKVKNNLSVTFGCVEMGRGSNDAGLAGTGAVVWTANSAEWSSTSAKQYMVPGETLTVAVDLSKLTTKITVGAGAAPAIGLGTSAANSTASVTVTGLAGQAAAADTTALTGLGYTAGTGNKSVTITGVAANNVLNAGVITFTITAGTTADAAMALTLTNA